MPRLLIAALFTACVGTYAQQAVMVRSVAGSTIPPYTSHSQLSGHFTSVGTDTMKDLMTSWIAGFTTLHPQVSIELQANGSLTAAPALIEGTAQLAPLSREMVPSEIARFKARYGYEPTAIRVALGSYDTSGHTVALALFVNADNPINQLDFTQLDAMYCTSHLQGAKQDITRWGQMGLTGDWADKPIHLIGVKVPDGISNFIRLRVCKDGTFRSGIHEENTGGTINVLDRIVTIVASDPDAIGYAGFANLKPGSKQIAISENSGGPFLHGTRSEVSSAQYPLTRYVYIYVNQAPGKPLDPALRDFFLYILSLDGQSAVEREGISMPLPAAIAAEQRAELK